MKKISPARIAAFEILLRIEKEKAFSSVLLPQYEEDLGAKDGSLCHELVLGVLRRKLLLDKLIEFLTKKDTSKFDTEVLIALRLGIYQIKYLDKIPAYSAINESVNLVHAAKKRSASGLVNAVLRKVAKNNEPQLIFKSELDRISIESSHPQWLVKRWIDQFGIEETERIAISNNIPPHTAFRFTARSIARGENAKNAILTLLADLDPKRSEFVEDCYLISKSNESVRGLASKGEIYFQDEASQMIAKICKLKKSQSFIDICAAPGSKTTLVAANSPGTLMVAGDRYEHRVKTLLQNCKNQGSDSVQIVRYDAAENLPFEDQSFDIVLLDSPCSGTGTIKHNPEIRYSLTNKDLDEFPLKQLMFLENASKLVKSGGKLIYSTCSLETEENEEVIEKFVTRHHEFSKELPTVDKKFLTGRGFSRTFPSRDSIDGFFAAVLKRS